MVTYANSAILAANEERSRRRMVGEGGGIRLKGVGNGGPVLVVALSGPHTEGSDDRKEDTIFN